MTGPLAALGARFAFNDRLFSMVTEGFGASDWRHRPEGGGNSAVWVAGHVAAYRRTLLRKLGDEIPDEPWEKDFATGVPCKDASAYPPAERLAKDFLASGPRLAERLCAMAAAEADAPWGHAFPDGSTTVAGGAGFLQLHETYHLGQLGYIRRTRGKKGFV